MSSSQTGTGKEPFSARRLETKNLQLKSHRREGTKKSPPAATWLDLVMVVALVVLAVVDLAAVGYMILWGLT